MSEQIIENDTQIMSTKNFNNNSCVYVMILLLLFFFLSQIIFNVSKSLILFSNRKYVYTFI